MNRLYVALFAGLSLAIAPQRTDAQAASGPTMELYGFAMMDAIADFKQNNPDWFDTMRPSKLPSFENEFGEDGRAWFSARQSRIGVRADVPTGLGNLFTQFEFEFFGVGVDAGQTTIRLRHAFGQLGQFGAGQTNSPFMDGDVFPNTVEYWGPNGMLFFRNVMVFWQPINEGGSRFTIALERPGASGDQGVYADRVELSGIEPRFPLPDLSAEYRVGQPWGYVELAGIVRRIHWDDMLADAFDLSGSTTGWGVSLSSNIKPSPSDVLRLQVVYGEGIENYFNDAPVDIGIEANPGDPTRPIVGVALPDLGISAYLDHTWTPKWSSSVGFAMVDIENSDGQAPSAYSLGRYASVNLLHTPVTNVMVGAELQYGDRENFSDGFKSEDYRVQFSFKYSFSRKFGM
jgi:hypothetical protein